MPRPSVRAQRRAEITRAFGRVLARHGFAGATVVAVAAEAGVAPGLIHHHFASKEDLMVSLLDDLLDRFRARSRVATADALAQDPLDAYVSAALALGSGADLDAARAWVGLFAEAIRTPLLFARVRRLVDQEIARIEHLGAGRVSAQDAGAVLAFVVGALVVGAFAPRKTAGFALPALRKFLRTAGRA